MPSSNVPGIDLGMDLPLDKIAHIGLYAIYTVFIGRYLTALGWKAPKYYLVLLAFPTIYGILMEVLQYALSPSRFFDMLDIIANIIGVLAGLLILKIKI